MTKLKGTSLDILKTVHLLFIGVFFGGLTAILVIISLKIFDGLTFRTFEADIIMYRINRYLVYYSLLGITTTAIVYGLYTKWGILRHRWIIIKWVLLFALAGTYIFAFSPAVNGLASLSSGGPIDGDTGKMYDTLVRKSLLSNFILLSFLLIIFFISTIKPFGRRRTDLFSENKIARISIVTLILLSIVMGLVGWINLNRLRAMKINNPNLLYINDGIYKGKFSDGAGAYIVEIEIVNHRMSQINLKSDRKSKYLDYAKPILGKIIEKQTFLLDGITGATTTSKCILKAAENALKSDYPTKGKS